MSIAKTLLRNEYIIVFIAYFTIVAGLWWIYFAAHRGEKFELKRELYFRRWVFLILSSATLIAIGIDIAFNAKTLKTYHTYVGIGLISISVVVFILSCLILKIRKCLNSPRKISLISILVIVIVSTYLPFSVQTYLCVLIGLIVIAVIIVEPMRVYELKNKSAFFIEVSASAS